MKNYKYIKIIVSFLPLLCAAICPLLAYAKSTDSIESAYVTLVNRSGYPMIYAVWEDGSDCSNKMELPPEVNLNLPAPAKIVIPAGKEVGLGVGIAEMRGKTPVFCEHIVSFVPAAHEDYVAEYYVRDRRCYALLHRKQGAAFVPVLADSSETLTEKMPEFGWDQFEPACM